MIYQLSIVHGISGVRTGGPGGLAPPAPPPNILNGGGAEYVSAPPIITAQMLLKF